LLLSEAIAASFAGCFSMALGQFKRSPLVGQNSSLSFAIQNEAPGQWRHVAAVQQIDRFRSDADIEPNLSAHGLTDRCRLMVATLAGQ
jgi:hypothetical protein